VGRSVTDNATMCSDLEVSRPPKMSPKDTVAYECDMLRFAWEEINAATARGDAGRAGYMRLECFLLHYRNLIQLLTPTGQRRDDLSLTTFDAQISADERDRLCRIAEPLRQRYSTQISKYLAHTTTQRHTTDVAWHPNKMYFELLPAVQLLCERIGSRSSSD
jgi:hypothetical protein